MIYSFSLASRSNITFWLSDFADSSSFLIVSISIYFFSSNSSSYLYEDRFSTSLILALMFSSFSYNSTCDMLKLFLSFSMLSLYSMFFSISASKALWTCCSYDCHSISLCFFSSNYWRCSFSISEVSMLSF